MIPLRDAIGGAVLIAVVGAASIVLITYIAISGIRERNDTITATRVAFQVAWDAHYETQVELAECRKQTN